MGHWETSHLTIIAKMLRRKVVKSHHKQRQTVIGWCSGYDGDVLQEAIDDLVTDPNAPVYEKGRGTITLRSIHEAKEFLQKHDEDDEFTWYL